MADETKTSAPKLDDAILSGDSLQEEAPSVSEADDSFAPEVSPAESGEPAFEPALEPLEATEAAPEPEPEVAPDSAPAPEPASEAAPEPESTPEPPSPTEPAKKQFGAHSKAGQSAYIQKSSRMRVVLIVVIVVLVLLLAAIGVLIFKIAETSTAVQQTLITDINATETEEQASDASPEVTKKTTVPDLVALLGATQDDALASLAHGAQIVRTLEVNEEGNPIKTDVQIALTEEPSDSRTGTPTVYLGLNEEGAIVRAGYSVATSSLGYGSFSFTDAVLNEHIIEKTLDEAGLTVSYGAVELPDDKMLYSTYDSDGTRLVKEYYAFNGVGQATGVEHQWEAILTYDYSMANATDNLSDTIRTIYVYIT